MSTGVLQSWTHCPPPIASRTGLDLRLSFAYSSPAAQEGEPDASAHQTSARNPRLPERIHPAARVRPEPRGNRSALRPFFARDRAQAPHEPAGEGVHQARLEPQPIGRDGPGTQRRHERVELPLLGYVAAGLPIEAVASNETIAVPEDLVGKRDTYVLRVRGDSMIDEQIRDGDFVVVEDRKTADNGEMVIALVRGTDVTLKKFYRDPGGSIRLQPANAAMQPIFVDPDQVQIQGVVVGVMRKY